MEVDLPLSIDRDDPKKADGIKTREMIFMAEDHKRIFWFNILKDELLYNELLISDLTVKQIKVFGEAKQIVKNFFSSHSFYMQTPRLYDDTLVI